MAGRRRDTVEVRDFDPGYDLTARVDTDLRTSPRSGAATSIGPQHHTDRMTILRSFRYAGTVGWIGQAHRYNARGPGCRDHGTALSRQLQITYLRSYQRVT